MTVSGESGSRNEHFTFTPTPVARMMHPTHKQPGGTMTHAPPPMPGYQPPPPKRKRTKAIVISAAAVVAAGIGGIVFWLAQPTYDDIVKDCARAVEAQAGGDKSKPDACQDVKDDDYSIIRMHSVLEKDGWFNEDGGVNRDKLINPDGE